MKGDLPRHRRRDSSPSSFDAANKPFNQCDLSLRIVLGFLSTRVLRGGPRIVVQLIVAAFSLILLAKFFTSPTADTILSSRSRWTWSPFGRGRDESQDVVGPGTVRLVAFGSPDIATPLSGKGWTEMLCEELRCSSHKSYIPSTANLPAAALTSHEHYRATIEKVTRELDQTKAPGYDYDFILQQFPLAESIADLAAQVDRFLAEPQPQPQALPRETVWVFSCGTWDVWTLSALPRDLGQGIVDLAVRALFAQVERVYQASLSTESVAFSDFWDYQDPSLLEGRLTGSNAGREETGGSGGDDEQLPVEKFRVIIPELFDVSLTPGWHAQRPAPPGPHTKAEQMTNAAHLTTRWNSEVRSRIAEWMRTPDPQPAAKTDDVNNDNNSNNNNNNNNNNSSNKNKSRGEKGGESSSHTISASKRTAPRFRRRTTASENDGDDDVLHVPYPRRLAAQVHTAEFVREAIIERQMRQHGLTDFTGRGNRTDADSDTGGGSGGQGGIFFSETWTPCIWAKTSGTPDTAGEYAACDTPGDYLFHSPFTLGERAIRETARLAAAETRSRLAFVDVVEEKEENQQPQEEGEGGQQQQQQHQQQHQDGDKKKEKQTAKRATRRERSADPSSLRRSLRPSLRARVVDAACPSLDVC